MSDLDRVLRRLAEDARAAAGVALPMDSDYADTLDRVAAGGVAPDLPRRRPPRSAAFRLAAAAALLAVLVGGIVLLRRGGEGDDVIVSGPATTVPQLSTSVPPTAPATTDPAPDTTAPAPSTTAAATSPGCLAGLDPQHAAETFADRLIQARQTGDFGFVASCLDTVPPAYTGVAPACWAPCPSTAQFFNPGSVRAVEHGALEGQTPSWFTSMTVTYRNGPDVTDVLESWTVAPDGDGYRVTGFTVETLPFDRDEALATLQEYFDHLDGGNWTAAAAMLDDGATPSAERPDLQRLAPATFTLPDIASALEDWCSAGCDTIPPGRDELSLVRLYGVSRGGERIEAAWFEGDYSIVGLPFWLASPTESDGVDAFAGWPSSPEPSSPGLASTPLLLPTIPVPGAEGAVRTEFVEVPEHVGSYSQVWYADDGGGLMTITTHLGRVPNVPSAQRIPTEIEPWDVAYTLDMASGFAGLDLADPAGLVSIWSWGLGADVVDRAARSLTARGGGPGWDVGDLPSSLVAVEEGWFDGIAVRDVYWLSGGSTVASMTILHGNRELSVTPWFPEADVEFTTVGEASAIAITDGRRAAVVWSPGPDVQVMFALVGSADDALALARSVAEVDQARWDAASTLDNDANEGCGLSLYC